MAESDANQTSETANTSPLNVQNNEIMNLKYLEFVQVLTVYFVVCVSTVYEYAKQNFGPLKPCVQTVEDTVKTVVGPLCDKLYDVLLQLLKFVDGKVDETLSELDRRVPLKIKHISSVASSAARRAPAAAREVFSEIGRVGLVGAARNRAKSIYTKCEPTAKELYSKYEPTAKELYSKYEPVAEQHAAATWRFLNKLPLFPQVAHVLVPTAAYWAEKYNQAVAYAAERHFAVSRYLPLVPIERIAKVFEVAGNGRTVSAN